MSRNDDMIVCFSGLKSGRYSYDFDLGKEFFERFENEELCDGKVHIAAVLEKNERVMMFNFELSGEVTTRCDRCLGEMKVQIEGKESLNVRLSDTEKSDDENVAILPEGAFEIDLAQWLYEYVAVRIPMQHVHPEGECDQEVVKYISDEEQEKEEGSVDPRWDALKKALGE
jgi:uncharacterized metal-binding protein YceD (DUF177 family)